MGFFDNGKTRKILKRIIFGLESGYPEVYYPDAGRFSLEKLSEKELKQFKAAVLATTTRVISVYGAEILPDLFGDGTEIRQVTEGLSYVPPACYALGVLPYGDELRRSQAMKYIEDYALTCYPSL